MARLAVDDARKRGVQAAEVAGARLGSVRLIDPTGRACETDVLVLGSGRAYANTPANQVAAPPPPAAFRERVDEVVVTGAKRKAQEVGLNPDEIRMPLQPPLRRLEQRACVVFALGT
jgi:uncharacterized protein